MSSLRREMGIDEKYDTMSVLSAQSSQSTNLLK